MDPIETNLHEIKAFEEPKKSAKKQSDTRQFSDLERVEQLGRGLKNELDLLHDGHEF